MSTTTITWLQQLLQEETASVRLVQGKLVHFPAKLRAAREKVETQKQRVRDMKDAVQKAEAEVRAEVMADTSLKNADQRKSALDKALLENGMIRDANTALRNAEGGLAQADIELQEIADQWRALRVCAEGSIAISRICAAAHGPHDHPHSL